MNTRLQLIVGFLLIATIAISQPTITSFTPTSGPIGTSVIITGTNFSTTAANNVVFFGATRAAVTAATAAQLTVTVPAGATYEPISVLVSGLIVYSVKPFVVTFANGVGISANAFAPKSDLATATSNKKAVSIGDIDGDGKPDLAFANSGSNTVSVLKNTSTAGVITYATAVNFTVGQGPQYISIGDFDGDGKMDLAVANLNNSVLSVLRNTSTLGTISFATTVNFSTGSGTYALAVGDIDGDGKVDIVTANSQAASISIFRNTGTSGTISFAARVDLASGSFPFSVSVDDMDGDGKKDVSVGNYGANSASIFRNLSTPGNLSFATRADFPLGVSPFFIATADLDGDGKPDLSAGSVLLSVLRNTSSPGSLSFTTKLDFTTGTFPISIALGDIDGDGKIDAVTTTYVSNGNNISVLKNNSTIGTIAFATKVDFATGASPRSVAMGDQDADGKADLAVANEGASTISIFRNTTKLNQAITFGALSAKVFGDPAFALTATASSGLPTTYTSSNTAVATVSGNMVTIVGGGTTTIIASQAGNAKYAAATSVPQTLTVQKAGQIITFAALPNKSFDDPGFNLTATVSSGLPINYTSGNTSVATVTGNTVTIVGVGTTTITATQAGNANYQPATLVFQLLTIVKANQNIVFGALAPKTFGDASFSLTAGASSGQPITYTSSNTAVATISGSAVTIVGAGATIITASQAGNGNYNPATNVPQTLTVNKSNQTITFGTLANKTVGDAPFALTATASSGLSVSYTSSNPSVATISGNTITVLAMGVTAITASQSGNANYNPALSEQQTLSVKQNQSITFGTLSDKTFGDAPFALTATSSSSLTVSFSSTSNIISISGNQVTLVSAGRVSVTASQAGDANYNPAASVDQGFCINPTKPTIIVTNVNTPMPTLTSSASTGNQWYLNGAIIAGASNATLQVTEVGIYKVQVQADDCLSEFSDEEIFVITGAEQSTINSIQAYPNPANDWLIILLGELSGTKEITIFDLNGKKLQSKEETGTETRLNVATYPSGIYVVKVKAQESITTLRFVKK